MKEKWGDCGNSMFYMRNANGVSVVSTDFKDYMSVFVTLVTLRNNL